MLVWYGSTARVTKRKANSISCELVVEGWMSPNPIVVRVTTLLFVGSVGGRGEGSGV